MPTYILIQFKRSDRNQIQRIAEALRADSELVGDPVIEVGNARLLVRREFAEQLYGSSDRLRQAFASCPVFEDALEIRDEDASKLIEARDPRTARVPRMLDSAPQTGDKFDWHLRTTKIPQAWELLSPGDFSRIDWGDLKIGQIDTGYRPQPVLGFDSSGASAFVDTQRDKNFFDGDPDDALDPVRGMLNDGHGLRTGSVLAGWYRVDGPPGTLRGYFGAAPKLPYLPVRICDSVIINHVQGALANAIRHLVDIRCPIITISMGFPSLFRGIDINNEVREAIDQAYTSGTIVIAAAGNYWPKVVAPACLPRTIAVAGSTPSLKPWVHSSCGGEVDICAPAWPVYRATEKNGRQVFGLGDGTSYATAIVAGVAALWLTYRRNDLAHYDGWRRVEAFRELLKQEARKPDNTWDSDRYGPGILDAEALLRATPPPPNALLMRP